MRPHSARSRAARPLTAHHVVAISQIKYSQFMHTLSQDNIQLNRKMLSELATNEPYSFKTLVDRVKAMRGDAPLP